jgi:hypothetical protein
MGISRFARLKWLRSWLGAGVGGDLVSEIFRQERRGSGTLRLSDSIFAPIAAKGAPGVIRRNLGVAA